MAKQFGLFNGHFYHSLLKKYTILFGTLFQNIDVVRYDKNNSESGRVTCPLSYSAKEKWLQRLLADPELKRQPAITLPRLAFEMTDISYAPERKLQKLQKFYISGDDANSKFSPYTPVPYNIGFNLYITTKTQDDMLQIVEQILPAFTPDLTVAIKGTTNANMSFDVPISINGIQKEDTYDSPVEEGRVIIWTIGFTLRGVLFGPVRSSNIIKHVQVTLEELGGEAKYATIDVEPFIDGVPVSEIRESDPWVANVTIEEMFP